MEAIDIMMRAYENNYKGSISELIQQEKQANMQVANTPEQREQGLRGQGAGNSMAFKNVGGESFNTVGMSGPMSMKQYDQSGKLIHSEHSLQPGLVDIPTDPKAATIIETTENPSYQLGGYSKNMRNWKPNRQKK